MINRPLCHIALTTGIVIGGFHSPMMMVGLILFLNGILALMFPQGTPNARRPVREIDIQTLARQLRNRPARFSVDNSTMRPPPNKGNRNRMRYRKK